MSERVTLAEARRAARATAAKVEAERSAELQDLCDEITQAMEPEVIERQLTYNPTTHRLVPKDAVVLEREDAEWLLEDVVARYESDLAIGCYDEGEGARIACLRSALAGEADTVEGEGGER